MPAAGVRAVSAQRIKAMLRDELRSFARGSVVELDRLSERSEHVRRARPVLLATAARGGRVLRTVKNVGPTIRPLPVLDQAYGRAVAAGRLLGAHHPLSVGAAGVARGLDVSLRLYGTTEACAAVTGLGLRPLDPDSRLRVPVPTTVVRAGTSVRLAASLPPERFAPPGETWLLEVLGTEGVATVVVPAATALEHRWPPDTGRTSRDAGPWPARLSRDRRGRLQVTAAVPPGPTVDFDVHIGPAAVTVTWAADAPTAALGMRPRGTTDTVEVPAGRGVDGRFSVELDASRLRLRPPVRLDLSVRSGEGPWVPLQRPKAEYPPLAKVVTFSAFPVAVPGLPPLSAQVYYTQDNRLAIRIETALRRAR